jgi:putative membrane protein
MMMIGMVVLWALLIWGAVYVAAHVTDNGSARRPTSALDTLEQRYARGEIDRDEFETRRTTLQNS